MGENVNKTMNFRPEITLGTLLVLVGMAASAGGLMYQIGETRAELADGISKEIVIREMQTKVLDDKITASQAAINDKLTSMSTDMRDFRQVILSRTPLPVH
jgi:hypothetical protein